MKAAVFDRYGAPEVLKVEDVPKPTPGPEEVLVRVHATSVTAGDRRMRLGRPFAARIYNGLFRPMRVRILGFEIAGEVEEVGSEIKRLKPGDEVFGPTGFGFGGYAEYRCLPTSGDSSKGFIVAKPSNIDAVQAAAVPLGGLAAWSMLHGAGIQPGMEVLVYGASGSVGTYAVQLARHYGATVTAVCSARNLNWVRELGADRVFDYAEDDLRQAGGEYDLVCDAAGKLVTGLSASQFDRLLRPGGAYTSVEDAKAGTADDLEDLKGLIEAGVVRAIVDRVFDLGRIADAHRYFESGLKRGNVVVAVEGGIST